jgi:DNA-binding GntR family transcriptional regulator
VPPPRRIEIDHDAEPFPFEQLAAALRSRIEDGTYAPGSRMPTHIQLEEESGLSPMAVRRAIRLLASQGWLRTKPGRGTFVVGADELPL